jgi:hypothetical protein
MPTEPPDELVEAVSSQLAGTDIPTRVVGEVLRAAHDAGLIVYRDEYERFDEQWIITGGEHNTSPVGPFTSEAEAHAEYKRNQPQGQEYLCAPTVVRLLRPAFGRFIFGKRR